MKKIFLIPCLCPLFFIGTVKAQRVGPGKPIVQSPYYDAVVLYYAFQNINAWPLPSTDVQVGNLSGSGSSNANKPVTTSSPLRGINPLFNPS